ncbi:MAG TPA: AbrB/MazE/SpoVT family DNA-binding domain-containing protein [Chloroflexota bacterium]|jgi:AbrB family looped-hinge helix DNA binding protein
MAQMTSVVGSKGRVTIPAKIRRMLGLKPKDTVTFSIVNGQVQIARALTLDDLYMCVPALKTPISDEEMIRQAWEEHIRHVAQEGLDP